jgi:hypothetical protein|tara:strand:- start:44 stop:415 length:372 start_codon:yes stop_codon:yes gene_type:complete
MAYFAKLGKGNIVENLISINNSVITDANGIEQEQLGNDFINKLYNTRDVWKQTSYNNNIRKNYAGIGYQYDQTRDAFIAPKPYNSWILNEDTCHWEAPVAYPDDGQKYSWNEETTTWDVVDNY